MTIELSDIDAERFKEFMEYYDKFSILKDSGCLDSVMAEVTLNFDSAGNISRIKHDRVLYIRKETKLTKATIVI